MGTETTILLWHESQALWLLTFSVCLKFHMGLSIMLQEALMDLRGNPYSSLLTVWGIFVQLVIFDGCPSK